jgi:hypothetical protein
MILILDIAAVFYTQRMILVSFYTIWNDLWFFFPYDLQSLRLTLASLMATLLLFCAILMICLLTISTIGSFLFSSTLASLTKCWFLCWCMWWIFHEDCILSCLQMRHNADCQHFISLPSNRSLWTWLTIKNLWSNRLTGGSWTGQVCPRKPYVFRADWSTRQSEQPQPQDTVDSLPWSCLLLYHLTCLSVMCSVWQSSVTNVSYEISLT